MLFLSYRLKKDIERGSDLPEVIWLGGGRADLNPESDPEVVR